MSMLKKAQSQQFTTPMSQRASELFFMACMLDAQEMPEKIPVKRIEEDFSFIMKVVLKRVEVLKLPISFTLGGLAALEALSGGNPGRAMVILMDCLTLHSIEDVDGLVTSADLAEMYPFGFYNEDTFCDYIDNEVKTGKALWSQIY
jgi:hypothetical protein